MNIVKSRDPQSMACVFFAPNLCETIRYPIESEPNPFALAHNARNMGSALQLVVVVF